MMIVEPTSGSDFRRYYDLRWRILRAPWDQPRGSERDEQDADATHLMVVNDSETLGVGRLHIKPGSSACIRYMAVDEQYRGSGIGSLILAELENRAVAQGVKRIILNARETAVGFYEKHGYRALGPAPTLFGCIAHVEMSKTP